MRSERCTPRERGRIVASAFDRAWRRSLPALDLSGAEIADITPLLLSTGGGGLIWRRIRDRGMASSPAILQLQQTARYQRLLAAVHERQVAGAVTLLRSAGVEPIVLKGWAAARLYPEAGLRPCGDVDLCVRPGQYDAALAALRSSAGAEFPVDLHRGIPWLDDRDLDDLYWRSRLVLLGETEVRILGPEDHLRFLCLHLLDHGAWRPSWLCDVGAALETRPASFDCEVFLGGNAWRSEWTACAIGLAAHLLGAEVEETPFAQGAGRLPRWLVRAVLRQWAACHRSRAQLAHHLRTGTGILGSLCRSWPDPITASLGVGAPCNGWPRLPFQLAQCAKRTVQIGAELFRPALR